jgi:site-specific DNA-methyltransferase (adenine-specific)
LYADSNSRIVQLDSAVLATRGLGQKMRLDSTVVSEAKRPRTRLAGIKHWDIGRHQVWSGDCIDALRAMPAASVNVIVTSPPYNIGVAYRSYDDRRPRAEYIEWLRGVGCELARVLKKGGSFFLNVGSTNADPWIAMDVAGAFRDTFVMQNNIVWAKSVAIGDDTVGHFKPINSRRFMNHNHESIFHFTLDGNVDLDRLAIGVPFKDKTNIARWGHSRDKRCAGNVWFIPYQTVRSKSQKFNHPAGFPVDLPKRCLQLHGVEDSVVLDPFLGAGTTLIAAEQLGMRGIGIEIDRHYAEIASERLRDEIDCANR